jgi:hypothetical protein
MSSWGNNDNAANAPYWAVNSTIMNTAVAEGNVAHGDAANVALLYGNTTPDVYTTGQTIGLFMVDGTEAHAGGDNVTGVSINVAGSGYVEAPGVTFSGGGGSGAAATATIADGVVTKITITNVGSSYETVPTVAVQVPVLTTPTSAITAATDLITYNAHGQANTAALTYENGGGASITGLTDGTIYYVGQKTTNTFKLYNTSANAATGGATGLMALDDTGNDAQYFIINAGVGATAVAVKGLGNDGDGNTSTRANKGWNLRTVGTGGRAGRVQYETLVALNEVKGDGSDDITLPDA